MSLPFRLYLISNESNYPGVLKQCLPELNMIDDIALQIREKHLSPIQQMEWINNLQRISAYGLPRNCFVNDRTDLAISLGLDGVHLRNDSLPCKKLHPYLRENLTIGVSAHSVDDVLKNEAEGADFVTLSPIFPTTCKPGATALGLNKLHEATRKAKIPVFALGGITVDKIKECAKAGSYGVAVISSAWGHPKPLEAIKNLRKEIFRCYSIF